jgi:hypothetical protein
MPWPPGMDLECHEVKHIELGMKETVIEHRAVEDLVLGDRSAAERLFGPDSARAPLVSVENQRLVCSPEAVSGRYRSWECVLGEVQKAVRE